MTVTAPSSTNDPLAAAPTVPAIDWIDSYLARGTAPGTLPTPLLDAFGLDRRWRDLFEGMAALSFSRKGDLRLLTATLKAPRAGIVDTVHAVFFPLPLFLCTPARMGGVVFLLTTHQATAWSPLEPMGAIGQAPSLFAEALDRAVALTDGYVLGSSVDFQAIAAGFDAAPHRWNDQTTGKVFEGLTRSLATYWLDGRSLPFRHGIRDLVRGLSFGGTSKAFDVLKTMLGPAVNTVCDRFGLTMPDPFAKTLPVVGFLAEDGGAEVLNFGLYLPGEDDRGGEYVLIKGASADADLTVKARSAGILVRKAGRSGQSSTGFAIEGELGTGNSRMRVRLRLEPGGSPGNAAKTLTLEARASTRPGQKPDWLDTLLGGIANSGGSGGGGTPPGALMANALGCLGDLVPTLLHLDAAYSLPEGGAEGRYRLSVVLGYVNPWTPFNSLFEISPQLVVNIDSGAGTHILMRGRLAFAGADFDLELDPQERSFGISLATGSAISLSRLFGETLDKGAVAPASTVSFPGLWVMDATFNGRLATGNTSDGTLFLEVVTGGAAVFALGVNRTLALGDVFFSVERDGDGRWSAELGGILSLNRIAVSFCGRYSPEEIGFECRIARLNLGELVDFALGEISVCPELSRVELAAIHLSYTKRGTETRFCFGACSGAPIPIGKLKLSIDRFEIDYQSAKAEDSPFTFDGALSLELDQTRIPLGLGYDKGNWTFKGDADALNLDLVAVTNDIARAFDVTLFDSEVPAGVILDDIDVTIRLGKEKTSLSLALGIKIGGTATTRLAIGIVKEGRGGAWRTAALVAPPNLFLPNLPVIGSALEQVGSFGITGVVLGHASQEVEGEDVPQLKWPSGAAPTRLREGFLVKATFGLHTAAGVAVEGWTRSFDLPRADVKNTGKTGGSGNRNTALTMAQTPEKPPAAPAGKPLDKLPDSPSASWIDIDKKIGPVTVARIGASLNGGKLRLLADAGITLGPVGFEVIGLAASTDAMALLSPKQRTGLAWELAGINVKGTGKGFALSGGLVKEVDGYLGQLLLTCGKLTLSAQGAYSEMPGGQPSLAVLARVAYPLGGPPAFFVDGLAAGFGLNRELVQPATLEEVPKHCLVRFIQGKSTMADLKQAAPTKGGSRWLALGVSFSSFLLMRSTAFLSVSFGNETVINLFGESVLELPPKPPGVSVPAIKSLAAIRFALMAEIRPDDGEIRMFGRILPGSFLFDEKAVVTGEFAFRCWFGPRNPLSGDFALTLGGYGPTFAAPAHYPKAAPFELNWQPAPELSVKGQCYFALTPSAVMAGGALSVTWQSGAIRAWFECQADLIIYFQPFTYKLATRVEIGVDAVLDLGFLTVHFREILSAGLELWGPPFDGIAHVSFHGVSFDVRLGKDGQRAGKAVEWDVFRKESLPANSIFSVYAPGCAVTGKGAAYSIHCVNPGTLGIEIATAVPAARVVMGDATGIDGTKAVGIRAMGKTSAAVGIVLEVKTSKDRISTIQNWVLTERRGSVASGIWEYVGEDVPPSRPTVTNVVTGLTLAPRIETINPGETASIWEACGKDRTLPASALSDPVHKGLAKDLSWLPEAIRGQLADGLPILSAGGHRV